MLDIRDSRMRAREAIERTVMNYASFFRVAMVALVPMVAAALPAARAQTPAPSTSAPSTPAPSAPPAPPPAETKTPGALPPPTPPAPPPAPVQAADPFGEQITLASKTVIATKGTAI